MITKDTIIGDALKMNPDIAGIMLEYGLHCVGCSANVYDTIENGCKIHGMDEEVVDKLVVQLNDFLEKDKAAKANIPDEVTVTEAAVKQIEKLLAKDDQEGYGLRVMVSPGGCSGFMYQMSFEEHSEEDDFVLEEQGVKIFIDKESMNMLKGAQIDYIDTLNESGFKINNPQAENNCGCGKSFS